MIGNIMFWVNRRTSFFPYLSITQAGMTVLLADVVLMPLNGGFGITFLLQKQAAAQALLLSTHVFKTSILSRDGECFLNNNKRRKKKERGGGEKGPEAGQTNTFQFSQILPNPLVN